MAFAIADHRPREIKFQPADGRTVLTITEDGRLVPGEGLSNDEASRAFLDVLSTCVASFLSELRQRAEKAEAELARLKAG